MKRLIRRWLIKSHIARHAAHLEAIQRERALLDRTEAFCVSKINALRMQQLNLDITARRHV